MKNIAIVFILVGFIACNRSENVDLSKLEKTVWYLQTDENNADSLVFGPENMAAYFIADHQIYNPLTYSISADTIIIYVSGGMQGKQVETVNADSTITIAPKPRAIWKFIQKDAALQLTSIAYLHDSIYSPASEEATKNKIYKLKQ